MLNEIIFFILYNLHTAGVLSHIEIILKSDNISRVPYVRDGWHTYCIPDTMESKNGQKLAE